MTDFLEDMFIGGGDPFAGMEEIDAIEDFEHGDVAGGIEHELLADFLQYNRVLSAGIPLLVCTYGPLAPTVEQLPCTEKVIGSNPMRSTERKDKVATESW